VDIRERALGPDHPDVAADVAALAALLDGQGKYDEAEKLYRRALTVFERVYGTEHYEIAVTLNNLAAIYHARGESEEAEELYQRALSIKEKALGTDHPDIAMTLNNLAVFYKSQQKYDQAAPLLRRALSIFENALGPGNLRVAICLDNLAHLLWKMGCGDEAFELKARADAIRKDLGVVTAKDVVATATINPQFACFALAVRASKVHRWGVFVQEQIPSHRKVIEYAGERITHQEAKRRGRSREYFFTLNKQWIIDGAVGGSGAELINHSCDPNLVARKVKGQILYVSRRPIEAGEELTVDYKFAPEARPAACHCGSPKCRGTINQKPVQSSRPYRFTRRKSGSGR
jgi:tetratricopeptide (TPR) repeat protein